VMARRLREVHVSRTHATLTGAPSPAHTTLVIVIMPSGMVSLELDQASLLGSRSACNGIEAAAPWTAPPARLARALALLCVYMSLLLSASAAAACAVG
jgi:hypothetical protein